MDKFARERFEMNKQFLKDNDLELIRQWGKYGGGYCPMLKTETPIFRDPQIELNLDFFVDQLNTLYPVNEEFKETVKTAIDDLYTQVVEANLDPGTRDLFKEEPEVYFERRDTLVALIDFGYKTDCYGRLIDTGEQFMGNLWFNLGATLEMGNNENMADEQKQDNERYVREKDAICCYLRARKFDMTQKQQVTNAYNLGTLLGQWGILRIAIKYLGEAFEKNEELGPFMDRRPILNNKSTLQAKLNRKIRRYHEIRKHPCG